MCRRLHMIGDFVKRFKNTTLFFLIYIIIASILTIPFYLFNIPYSIIGLVYYILMCVFIAISSAIMACLSETKGWFSGLLNGVVFIALLFIFVVIITGFNISYMTLLKKLPLLLFISFASGIIGVNIKAK